MADGREGGLSMTGSNGAGATNLWKGAGKVSLPIMHATYRQRHRLRFLLLGLLRARQDRTIGTLLLF